MFKYVERDSGNGGSAPRASAVPSQARPEKRKNPEASEQPYATSAPILVVDDDPDIRSILRDRLKRMGHPVLTAEDGTEGLQLAGEADPAVMFVDLQMPGMDGMELMKRVKAENPEAATIMITGHGTVEKAVEAMKEGAFDFITKPFCMAQLDVVIKRALERHYLKRENTWLKQQANATVPQIIGESSKLKEVVEIAERVASTSSTVLLLGESGSGKEVFARWIHHVSPRANAPFVAVNCVALRDELLESELFGHERGAFTGARETRQGKLEVANGGTVFLDEIGDFKLELQAKLLRVLQEREFERVGGNKRIQVDIRVIAATNRDLQKDVQEGRFREDLFFRLNVVAISLPPLRQRTEDIPMLADYFLQRCCRRLGRPLMKFSPAAMNHLLRYQWPGNVRELGNLIERAVILTRNATITPEDLPVLRSTGVDKDDALGASYRDSMREHQRRVIRHALKTSGGNKARAAELLEMQRTYLSRLIRKLKITDNNDSG